MSGPGVQRLQLIESEHNIQQNLEYPLYLLGETDLKPDEDMIQLILLAVWGFSTWNVEL